MSLLNAVTHLLSLQPARLKDSRPSLSSLCPAFIFPSYQIDISSFCRRLDGPMNVEDNAMAHSSAKLWGYSITVGSISVWKLADFFFFLLFSLYTLPHNGCEMKQSGRDWSVDSNLNQTKCWINRSDNGGKMSLYIPRSKFYLGLR